MMTTTLKKHTTGKYFLFVVLSAIALSISLNIANAQVNDEYVLISVDDDAQSVINSYPSGTTFLFETGVHRMESIDTRDNDIYIGQQGAVLNGARLLTNFQREGDYWVVTGQTQQGYVINLPSWNSEICDDGFDRCRYPEDLYFDNQPLTHVSSLNQVRSGTWYFDYANDRIYFSDDPTGHVVETSVTERAFSPRGDNVTIMNLTVEKYASPIFRPAIYTGIGWVIDGVTAQLNHSAGIKLEDNALITNSRIVYNGQIGIQGVGNNYTLQNNEIAYNNWANFNPFWEAGGVKFARATGAQIRNNYVHHNNGPGLWVDIDNLNLVLEDNIAFSNLRHGIYYEISYAGTIRNNTLMYNNPGSFWALIGGQIRVENSSNVEIYGNRVVVGENEGNGISITNGSRGSGEYGRWQSYNVNVFENTIIHTADMGRSGVQPRSIDYDRFWRESNNSFNANTYYVQSNPNGEYWYWREDERTFAQMQELGQEINGRVIVGIPEGSTLIPAWNNTLVSYPVQERHHATQVLNLNLFNAETRQPLGELENNMVIDLDALESPSINISATMMGLTGSVQFLLDGQTLNENIAPYRMWGDDGNWSPSDGTYTLTVIPYTGSDGSGTAGHPYTVTFTIVNGGDEDANVIDNDPTEVVSTPLPEDTPVPLIVDGFTLIDAESDEPIMPVADGDVINLADLPSTSINMRVDITGNVGSVAISKDGEQTLENNAPYAIWDDNNGDYIAITPELREYTVAVVPYTEEFGRGSAGVQELITFSFINEVEEPTFTSTPTEEPTFTSTPTEEPTPEPTEPVVETMIAESFTLINADTEQALDVLVDGAIINLATLPTDRLNIRADVNGDISSVLITIDNASRIENAAPYATFSDSNGDYHAWIPELRAYTFEAVPFSGYHAGGTEGEALAITVSFINEVEETPTPTPEPAPVLGVERLVLINAETDEEIMPLNEGDVINLAELPTDQLNIDVETAGEVVSVAISYDSTSLLENAAPYAVFSDSRGDYYAWTPELRAYTFEAVPFSGYHAGGTEGEALAITVSFINEVEETPTPTPEPAPVLGVERLVLINAETDEEIMPLNEGDVINLAELPTDQLNVGVETTGEVESVAISYDTIDRVENAAPYAVFSDSRGDYRAWTPELRAYTFDTMPFTRNGGRGEAGEAFAITVLFIDEPIVEEAPVVSPLNVTQFTLMNADTDQPIRVLTNNDVVDLATLPTRNINIKVDTSGSVESVMISYDGGTLTENNAPYAVWSNNGNDFYGWTPELRAYTFGAVPYSEDYGRGSAGNGLTITVTFTESAVQAPVTTQTLVEIPPVTNNNGGNTNPNVNTAPVVVESNLPVVNSFTLINADTNQPISILNNGATVALSQLPTPNINVRADISSSVNEVEVVVNGNTFLELGAPYSLWRDDEGNYHNANLTAGQQYTLSATPIVNGQRGQTFTIVITVVD